MSNADRRALHNPWIAFVHNCVSPRLIAFDSSLTININYLAVFILHKLSRTLHRTGWPITESGRELFVAVNKVIRFLILSPKHHSLANAR